LRGGGGLFEKEEGVGDDAGKGWGNFDPEFPLWRTIYPNVVGKCRGCGTHANPSSRVGGETEKKKGLVQKKQWKKKKAAERKQKHGRKRRERVTPQPRTTKTNHSKRIKWVKERVHGGRQGGKPGEKRRGETARIFWETNP